MSFRGIVSLILPYLVPRPLSWFWDDYLMTTSVTIIALEFGKPSRNLWFSISCCHHMVSCSMFSWGFIWVYRKNIWWFKGYRPSCTILYPFYVYEGIGWYRSELDTPNIWWFILSIWVCLKIGGYGTNVPLKKYPFHRDVFDHHPLVTVPWRTGKSPCSVGKFTINGHFQ